MGRDFLGQLPIVSGMGFTRGILLLDDCEGEFTWTASGTGGDDVHEYLAAAAFMGTKGLHLKTRVTAHAENDTTVIAKSFSYPESGLLLLRLRLAIVVLANLKTWRIDLTATDGTNQCVGGLIFTPATPKLEYVDAANNPAAIAACAYNVGAKSFELIELAMDCRTQEYLWVRFGGTKVALDGVTLSGIGANVNRGAQISLTITAAAAAAAEIYGSHIYIGEFLEP